MGICSSAGDPDDRGHDADAGAGHHPDCVWIGVAMAVGIGLGRLFPGLDETLDRVKIDTGLAGSHWVVM